MDTTTFVIRLVEALAWPVVVGLVFWCLRGPIARRIETLQTLKYKGAEATFGKELDRVEDSRPPPPKSVDEPPEI